MSDSNITITDKPLDKLVNSSYIPLTITLFSFYYNKGYNLTQIGGICGITRQAVSDFKLRHSDDILELLDNKDELVALDNKLISYKARRQLHKVLAIEPDKKDGLMLNIIDGTHQDKYRLMSDKSTANINTKMVFKVVYDSDNPADPDPQVGDDESD